MGGGAVLDKENCLKLQKNGILVYLEVKKEIIKSRILINGTPSFLDSEAFEHSFEKMYEERNPFYLKISPFKVTIHQKTDQEVLDELIALIRK